MRGPTDDELDFLLARGRMSGATRERVLLAVTEATRPSRPLRWIARAGLAGASLALAAAVLLRLGAGPQHEAFRAKGEGLTSTAVDVLCVESGTATCRVGETLVFRLDEQASAGYLAAYATTDREGGEPIWYFPEADGSTPEILPRAGAQVVPRGIRLGPEHRSGRYVVRVIVARRPLTRAAALDVGNADVLLRSSRVIEVVP